MDKNPFKTSFARDIFFHKYAHSKNDTWYDLAVRLVDDVCGTVGGTKPAILDEQTRKDLVNDIFTMKFIPGGRYLYYAGRPLHAYNNCFLLRAESDDREEWGDLIKRSSDCLMLGGGIGIDYSNLRCRNTPLSRTGGKASGPIPLMYSVNEYGRNVMQGGSRRSAIYASLNWKHGDAVEFLKSKNWHDMPIGKAKKHDGKPYTIADAKRDDFNFHAPLDMTNISLNYDDEFLAEARLNEVGVPLPSMFVENCRQAMKTGEPGFSFNFGSKSKETLRNACVTGDTKVLTDTGHHSIESLVGKTVSAWNGYEWSTVQPKVTGENEPVITINFSCGSSITCTKYHEFIVPIGYTGDFVRVKAADMSVGTKIKKFKYPVIQNGESIDSSVAYTQGFVSGDGMDGYDWFCLYEPKFNCLPYFAKTSHSGVGEGKIKVNLSFQSKPKSFVPFEWDLRSRASWLAGLCDSDGCLLNEGGIQISSVDRGFLGDIQMMLTTMGIHSKIVDRAEPGYRPMPDGHGGVNDYWCQQLYAICISSTDVQLLSEYGMVTHRMDLLGYKPNRNASRFPYVTSIQEAGVADKVYCFNEPKRHMGCFNGIVTGQCTEVTSEDDSDVCNLGSVNMGSIDSIDDFRAVCSRASMFLVCGTIRADLPYRKVHLVREKNRRLGLGLMGMHEWLLKRSQPYTVTPQLNLWLAEYVECSEAPAKALCKRLSISIPVAYRAIAPTGSIGILASTTTGIEPLFAVAFKRRYLTEGTRWKYQYVVDATADRIISDAGVDPDSVETAASLASDVERRVKFQYDVQKHVDMSISSTINMPAWGTELNNEDKVGDFASVLAKYAHGLRGFTCYPDGSRGGQPLTPVSYSEAKKHDGVIFDETDVCEWSGKGGTCSN